MNGRRGIGSDSQNLEIEIGFELEFEAGFEAEFLEFIELPEFYKILMHFVLVFILRIGFCTTCWF